MSQQDNVVTVVCLGNALPPSGIFVQHKVAASVDELAEVFAEYWRPYWGRDDPVEASQLACDAQCLLQRGARLLADPQPLHEVEDAGVGAHVLRELVPVPAGQVADELAVLQRRADGPPGPGVQHGRQLPEVSQHFTSALFSPTQARSAQSAMSSCVISSTASQSSVCALPPRTYLRTQWSFSPCLRSELHVTIAMAFPGR